jgi:hypothetical protein
MSSTANTPLSSHNNCFGGLGASSFKELSSKLTQWRGQLPRELQWVDDDPTSFPTPQPANPETLDLTVDPDLSTSADNSGLALFTADRDSPPVYYPHIYDIQVALLRMR